MNASPKRLLFPCVFPQPQITRRIIGDAPASLDGLRVLFVSDVHLRKCVSDEKLDALIALIGAQQADLLLLGGDYGEGVSQCARFFNAICRLRFPLGIFAVPGNNDDPAALPEIALDSGIRLLVNETASVSINGTSVEIGGCDDHKFGQPSTGRLFSDSAEYRIFLAHFPILPEQKCDLQFSGHTHGGQISLFGLTIYSLPYEGRFRIAAVRGDNRVNGTRLIVSNGIGISKLPVRFCAAPEIILTEFHR